MTTTSAVSARAQVEAAEARRQIDSYTAAGPHTVTPEERALARDAFERACATMIVGQIHGGVDDLIVAGGAVRIPPGQVLDIVLDAAIARYAEHHGHEALSVRLANLLPERNG